MVEQNYTLQQEACVVAGAGVTAVKRLRQQYLTEQSGKPLPNRRALTLDMQEIQQLKQRNKNPRSKLRGIKPEEIERVDQHFVIFKT